MPRLSEPRTLLAAWEAAAPLPDVARAAEVLASSGAAPVEAVLDLSLATCAALAVTAYIDAFGHEAECSCPCGACGEAMDVLLDLREFAAAGGVPAVTSETVTIEGGARSLAVRALTTRDLLAAAAGPDPTLTLLRCSVCDEGGRALSPGELAALDDDDLSAVDAAADHLAGIGSILLRMRCPACGADTRASVDPGGLLWERVEATAPRLLAEVAALARAFGWSEDAVLALSTSRRRAYLQLALAAADEPAWEAVGR